MGLDAALLRQFAAAREEEFQFPQDIFQGSILFQMNRRVVLLNDCCPLRSNIRPNNDLSTGMLVSQRKHFRNRQGFVNVKTGGN